MSERGETYGGRMSELRRRYFELVKEHAVLPVRATQHSAGYDICAMAAAMIPPGEIVVIPTGIRVKMTAGEYLQLSIRSSLGKKGLVLVNAPGVIDCDYYDNPSNGGEIMLMIGNIGRNIIAISKNDKVAQGIFQPYFICDDDNTTTERVGGIGSTG